MDLSQAKLGRLADLNSTTVCQVESGRLKPYRGQLRKLAQALEYTGRLEDLVEEVPANCGCQNTSESEGETR